MKTRTGSYRKGWIAALGMVGAAAMTFGTAKSASAEDIVFAEQFGLAYLPLIIMREYDLVEKHAAKQGIKDVEVKWSKLGGGATINDALISGSIDFGAHGAGPLSTLWSATKGTADIHGVSNCATMPAVLVSRDPKVKSLKDIGPGTKIGLPSVKTSMQARVLQMAAQQAGMKFDALDKYTVSMKHPDAMAALLSGQGITAHFASPPYFYKELEAPGAHALLTTFDVLGGPNSFVVLSTRKEVYEKKPKVYQTVWDAFQEAIEIINKDKDKAAEVYKKQTKSSLDLDFLKKIMHDERNTFETTPRRMYKFAHFMYEVGAIKHDPKSWKDLFFPNVHNLKGS